jgi:hypothetical protein
MEVTDLLGFPLRDFLFPGQKKHIELKDFFKHARRGREAGAETKLFSRTDPLSNARTSPRKGVRIEEGQA